MSAEGKGLFEPSVDYFQIAIVVKNIDETVKFYQENFGFGPFEFRDANFPTATYFGKQAGYRGRRAWAWVGPVHFELIEHVDGKTIHEDFLKEKGEGLQHLGFGVKDLKASIKEAEKKGFKVIQSFFREEGTSFAYLDSDKVGGVIFEMIQNPKRRS